MSALRTAKEAAFEDGMQVAEVTTILGWHRVVGIIKGQSHIIISLPQENPPILERGQKINVLIEGGLAKFKPKT